MACLRSSSSILHPMSATDCWYFASNSISLLSCSISCLRNCELLLSMQTMIATAPLNKEDNKVVMSLDLSLAFLVRCHYYFPLGICRNFLLHIWVLQIRLSLLPNNFLRMHSHIVKFRFEIPLFQPF